jgi:2-keto-4-pentenoate hydratase/2-oxohepta-3-ene-1,7-dioic acid hydratase in catechol pathway
VKLVTIAAGRNGTVGAILSGDEVLDICAVAQSGGLEAWIPASMRDLLEAGADGLAIVRRLVDRLEAEGEAARAPLRARRALAPFDKTRLLAPIVEPRLVIGGGLNYRSHLKEMAGTPEPTRPTGFLKTISSVAGPDATIHAPQQARDMIDWEGEVACVIGRGCHNVSAEEAWRCIAGYTIVNDVSARNWVRDVFEAAQPWDARLTWELNIMGKQFAGFTTIGPALVTADEIGDPNDLTLTTRLNGEVVQTGHTGDAIFDFGECVSFYSRWYSFSPGDIVTTGTPAGVGAGKKPPRYMNPGDTIEVEVSRIGVLRNVLSS